MKKWLSASDPTKNLREALKLRHEGTGLWFLQGKEFEEWKSGARRSLWLRGIPGAGKTVLSSGIIDFLTPKRTNDSSPIVLYFFFDIRDIEKQTLNNLIRSLIEQLYSVCEGSQKQLDMLFSGKCQNGDRQPSSEDLIATFESMVGSAGNKIQIVVDALDECCTKEQLLKWMKTLSSSSLLNVYLLVTSRDEKELELRMRDWFDERDIVSIQRDVTDNDILKYVQHMLHKDNSFEEWRSRPGVLEEMQNGLMVNANGMYDL